MGLFSRLRRGGRRASRRAANSEDLDHLKEWTGQRRGVEAYLEPRTTVTETTMILIAHDGEWTRRRVRDAEAGQRVARKLGVPCYEVHKVGYPQRMRDYTARQRVRRKRDYRRRLGE